MRLRNRPLLMTCCLLCLGYIHSYGQTEWSLERCIRHAWENNLRIQRQDVVSAQEENRWKQSRLDYIPTLSGSLGHHMNWGRSVDLNDLQIVENRLSQGTSAQIGAHIVLFEGMAKQHRTRSRRLALDLSLQEASSLRNEIAIAVTRAFLELLLAQEIGLTAENNFQSISVQKERTVLLVATGKQSRSSLLEIEAQMAQEKVAVIQARNRVETARLVLLQLLDLPHDGPFSIKRLPREEDPLSFIQDPDILYRDALSLPRISSARMALEKSGYDLKLARGRYYPTLSLSVSYSSYYSSNMEMDFFSQFLNNRNPGIVLGLSIPVFNGRKNALEVKNARLEVKSRELELEQRRQNLYKEIQKAISDARGYRENLNAAAVHLQTMEESFSYVEARFDSGFLNGTDYTVAKNNLFKAQSQYHQARFQFLFQLKIIDFYKGIPIRL